MARNVEIHVMPYKNVTLSFISLIHVMVQHYFADNASFNEKPHVEPKKSFSAKYVGCIDVPKPTGLTALFVVVVGLFVVCVCVCVYVIGHSPSGLFRTNVNK